ncbi:transposase family protein [Streptomyces cyaneus]|uniref:transposase family protein n=1 Tax=Streptomyces cyaneus TaxID=1904 RepID=UPI0013E3198A
MTADGNLVVDAAGCGPPGRCPQCEHSATRVHSRYWRQISELPVGGRRLIVRILVRNGAPGSVTGLPGLGPCGATGAAGTADAVV